MIPSWRERKKREREARKHLHSWKQGPIEAERIEKNGEIFVLREGRCECGATEKIWHGAGRVATLDA